MTENECDTQPSHFFICLTKPEKYCKLKTCGIRWLYINEMGKYKIFCLIEEVFHVLETDEPIELYGHYVSDAFGLFMVVDIM